MNTPVKPDILDLNQAFKASVTKLQEILNTKKVTREEYEKTRDKLIQKYINAISIKPSPLYATFGFITKEIGMIIKNPAGQKAYYLNQFLLFSEKYTKEIKRSIEEIIKINQ